MQLCSSCEEGTGRQLFSLKEVVCLLSLVSFLLTLINVEMKRARGVAGHPETAGPDVQQEQISPLEQVHTDYGGIKVRDSFVQGPSLETPSLSCFVLLHCS